MGLIRKKAIKDLKASDDGDLYAIVRKVLESDKNNAYTISGLLIEQFGVKESSINAPFKFWDKGVPSLYSRIRHYLEQLVSQKLVRKVKDGKAFFYYWIG